MIKDKVMIQIDPDVRRKLDAIASRYSFTANTLIAAAATELSRIPAEQLWTRLARLAAEETSGKRRIQVDVAPVIEATVDPSVR